jgi:hypothetical protein
MKELKDIKKNNIQEAMLDCCLQLKIKDINQNKYDLIIEDTIRKHKISKSIQQTFINTINLLYPKNLRNE